MDLTDALHRERSAEAAAHLRRMTHGARYSRHGSQHAGVIKEASKIRVLRSECREFVDVVLERLPRHRRSMLQLRRTLSGSSRS